MKIRTRKWLGQLLTLYIPLAPFVLFALFPFYFMAVTSFKTDGGSTTSKRSPSSFSGEPHLSITSCCYGIRRF